MIATNETRTIRLASMTRVEGEGGLRIEVRDGHLSSPWLKSSDDAVQD